MKKIRKSILFLILAISLVACGNEVPNETANEPPIETPNQDTSEPQTEEQSQGQITNFDLEIEVANQDKVDIDFEVERAETEATYSVDGEENLKGAEALSQIELMFNELNLTKDVNEDEIIDQVLTYFNINPADVTDFDLDIEFDYQEKIDINRDQLS